MDNFRVGAWELFCLIVLVVMVLAVWVWVKRQGGDNGGQDDHFWYDYSKFRGENLDKHEQAHFESAMLERACSLANQRSSGRHTGPNVTVKWTPGRDWRADTWAKWLLEHGPQNGVFVEVVDQKKDG